MKIIAILLISLPIIFFAVGLWPLAIILLPIQIIGIIMIIATSRKDKKQQKQDNAYASFNEAALEAEQMAWNMKKKP